MTVRCNGVNRRADPACGTGAGETFHVGQLACFDQAAAYPVTVTDRPRARWASGGRLFCAASIPGGKPGLSADARQAGAVTAGRAAV